MIGFDPMREPGDRWRAARYGGIGSVLYAAGPGDLEMAILDDLEVAR